MTITHIAFGEELFYLFLISEYAAAFFLLGRSLKDAVNVCLKQLKDIQLAIALARIMENGDDGPVLKEILTGTVLPTAFQDGNRWLASWGFWMLHRRDLSVRILVVSSYSLAFPSPQWPNSESLHPQDTFGRNGSHCRDPHLGHRESALRRPQPGAFVYATER